MPPPRADAPMDPNQLQQATEDLITDRNHLNAEMQNNGPGKASTNPPGNTKDSAKSPPPAKSQPAAAAPGSTQGASGVAGAQTAGAETK